MDTVDHDKDSRQLRGRARIGWVSLGLAVGLHLLVLALLPHLDTQSRCPVVMLVSLADVRAEEKPVAAPPPPAPELVASQASPAPQRTAATRAEPTANLKRQTAAPQPRPAAVTPPAATAAGPPAAAEAQGPSVAVQSPTRVESRPAGATTPAASTDGSGAAPAGAEVPAGPAAEAPVAGSPGAELPGPPKVPAQPRVDRDAVVGAYKRELAALVASEKFYPADDRDAGHTGTVKVRFEIGADGTLRSSSVVQSSGYPGLDAAALEAVERAAGSFPPIPAELGVSKVGATIPLRYGLR